MIVIVGLVLLYGYGAVRDFGKKSQQIDLIESKGEIRNAISDNKGYRVIRKVPVDLPSPYTHICFVSSDYIGKLSSIQTAINDVEREGHDLAIIKDSIDTGYGKNMFYFPDGTEAMDVGAIEVNNGFICLEKVGGTVTLRLEGLGDAVKVREWGT